MYNYETKLPVARKENGFIRLFMTAAKYNLTWHQVAFVIVFSYLLHLFHFNLTQNRKPYLNTVKWYNHCNE